MKDSGPNSLNDENKNQQMYESYMARARKGTIYDSSILTRENSHWYIISYHSINMLRFNFLTCMLILYECIMTPLQISFGLQFLDSETINYIEKIEYGIAAIFFLDIIICFFSAYINDKTGEHVTSLKLIAKKYLQFYFWIDLAGCVFYMMPKELAYVRSLSLVKTIRLKRF